MATNNNYSGVVHICKFCGDVCRGTYCKYHSTAAQRKTAKVEAKEVYKSQGMNDEKIDRLLSDLN